MSYENCSESELKQMLTFYRGQREGLIMSSGNVQSKDVASNQMLENGCTIERIESDLKSRREQSA